MFTFPPHHAISVEVGLQLNKTGNNAKFTRPEGPKGPKGPHFSVVFFSESTRGIARGDSAGDCEKKALAWFQ